VTFRVPDVEGALSISQSLECCEQQAGAMTPKDTISGSLAVPFFDTGKLTPLLPPWSNNLTITVFGHAIGVKYGVFAQLTGKVGVTLARNKRTCTNDVCWTGALNPAEFTLAGGLTGSIPNPTAFYTCGPKGDQQCNLLSLDGAFQTGFSVSATVGCDKLSGDIGWGGLKILVTAKAFEGTIFEGSEQLEIPIFDPGRIALFSVDLPTN
jgi:hypothetical protein